ncbi:MAG: hypothetical protein JSV44_02705 [Candidatus Zixiibacteriota bacterium]|nr:MAG: hypothetical protein JSV44_02705 [candidate division Zixibacteria bacterium]
MKHTYLLSIGKIILCITVLCSFSFIAASAQEADSAGNRRPIIALIGADSLAVDEGDTLEIAISAADPDGTVPALSLEYAIENAVFTDSLNGQGVFLFTPDFEREGDYSVAFIASDGKLADTVTVAISVNNITVFRTYRLSVLIFMLVFSGAVLLYTRWARQGKILFVRKIPGIDAVEEAVGRATEMGKPVLFIPGISDIDDIETIAGLAILGRVARITARYDTPLRVPVRYPMILAAGQEVVEQAYIEAGRHDVYDRDTVRYVAGEQFAFTATVNGMMMRDKPAANIYMGAFFAESLLLAETGNAAGSIQIAGTARPEQLPFFIAACDYTLMGEELYAASSYLSREPLLLGGLKGQDFVKIILIAVILAGATLVTLGAGDWFRALFRVP